MRILLDECAPGALMQSPTLAGHIVEHAGRSALVGHPNGEVHRKAKSDFDLLISSDLHFKKKTNLVPTRTLGVVVIRVVPNRMDLVVAAFERFAAAVDITQLAGKLAIVWRDRWEIREGPFGQQ